MKWFVHLKLWSKQHRLLFAIFVLIISQTICTENPDINWLTCSIAQIAIASVHRARVHGSISLRDGVVRLLTYIACGISKRAVLEGCWRLYTHNPSCNGQSHTRVVVESALDHGRVAAWLVWTWIIQAWITFYTQSCWKTGNETAHNLQQNNMEFKNKETKKRSCRSRKSKVLFGTTIAFGNLVRPCYIIKVNRPSCKQRYKMFHYWC